MKTIDRIGAVGVACAAVLAVLVLAAGAGLWTGWLFVIVAVTAVLTVAYLLISTAVEHGVRRAQLAGPHTHGDT